MAGHEYMQTCLQFKTTTKCCICCRLPDSLTVGITALSTFPWEGKLKPQHKNWVIIRVLPQGF